MFNDVRFVLLRAPRDFNLVVFVVLDNDVDDDDDLCDVIGGESLTRGTDFNGVHIVRAPPLRLASIVCGCDDDEDELVCNIVVL